MKQPNIGKWRAQYNAYRIADTTYITEIDSDDELYPTAIEDIENHWISIEREGKKNVAKLSLFVKDINNNFVGVGNFALHPKTTYLESFWQEYVLKFKCHREFLSSLDRLKFLDALEPYFSTFSSDENIGKFLSEEVIWSILGKKYKTRIINKIGRIVHTDADNSILRNTIKDTHYNNNIVANDLLFINLNIEYFNWNPKYFIGHYRNIIRAAASAGIEKKKILNNLKSKKAKILFYLTYPFFTS